MGASETESYTYDSNKITGQLTRRTLSDSYQRENCFANDVNLDLVHVPKASNRLEDESNCNLFQKVNFLIPENSKNSEFTF